MSVAAGSTSPSDFDALHEVRVRGIVPLGSLTGNVDTLIERGLLVATKRGYLLSPAGLELHSELADAWRVSVDLGLLGRAYERFLAVNVAVKESCVAWQVSPRDDDARFVAVDTLGSLLDRATPGLRRAGAVVPRFHAYADRLQAAIDKAGTGEIVFLTDPHHDSVHTIWFECHEDFLVCLGISREEEGSH